MGVLIVNASGKLVDSKITAEQEDELFHAGWIHRFGTDYTLIKDKPLVFYTNEHTDGRVMRFYWKKKYSTLPNKSVYAFCPTQQHKTKLTEMIRRNPNKQYCEKF